MTKIIQLTRGKVALVDDEDFERINQFTWHCSNRGYAMRSLPRLFGRRKAILMHREILATSGNVEIDHANMDKLDNRKANLRICTHGQNMHNYKKPITNASGFKGVSWHEQNKKWRATLQVGGHQLHLGTFDDPTEAARAYDIAARKYHGEFAKLNFLGEE
jgi:hypothetical protein